MNKPDKKECDVIVLGAGAAGLMCALTAGQRGRSVLVLDSSNKAGKKILMSGGGRCNFTNLNVEPQHFLSQNPHFSKSALSRYTSSDFIELVQRHGIAYEERKHGQLFCVESSKDILNMLVAECDNAGVIIHTDCSTNSIACREQRFTLNTSKGSFQAAALVIATGALSIPTLGASGFGYAVAEQFGLNVLPRRAGLVPFVFSDDFQNVCKQLSGVSVDALLSTGNVSFRENMLFTHRGLSGPAVLQLSNYWREGNAIEIKLLPDLDLPAWLIEQKQQQNKILLRTLLAQYLPKALVTELQCLFWPDFAEKPLNQCSDKQLTEIGSQLQAWQLKPSGTEGYRTAEVTLGGVDTAELDSKTMQCKKHPGLYFVGEVVDVTGQLGGFNFQWAWASGYCAGQYV